MIFIVEDQDVGIAAGIADGQRLFVGYLLINNIIGAVEGNLLSLFERAPAAYVSGANFLS